MDSSEKKTYTKPKDNTNHDLDWDENSIRLETWIMEWSLSKTWKDAKREWKILDSYVNSEADVFCLCGYNILKNSPIYVMRNKKTNNLARVGEFCRRKFVEIENINLFWESFLEVLQNKDRSLNLHALNYSHKEGWMSDRELQFSCHVFDKSHDELSEVDKETRMELMKKCVDFFYNKRQE